MIFRVIRDHLTPEFAVGDCCRVLGVSRSGYYRWRRQPIGRRAARRSRLIEQIRSMREENRGVYGSPKLTQALRALGVHLNHKTVA